MTLTSDEHQVQDIRCVTQLWLCGCIQWSMDILSCSMDGIVDLDQGK